MFSYVKSSTGRGFTLIELLVVIAIIGILASTVLASLSSARASARDAKRITEAKQLQTALELNRNQNRGSYPICGSGNNDLCGATLTGGALNAGTGSINLATPALRATNFINLVNYRPSVDSTTAMNYRRDTLDVSSYVILINLESLPILCRIAVGNSTNFWLTNIDGVSYPNCI